MCFAQIDYFCFLLLAGGAAGTAELMTYLQELQQLTYLGFRNISAATAPAAAYSALTASSKLQHLDISNCTVPAGAWQHVFPAGRLLPHLRVLDLLEVCHSDGHAAAAPEGSPLVSCCPGLLSLQLLDLHCSAELLAPLQGLSSLHELTLCPDGQWEQGLEVVSQLSGLRRLCLTDPSKGEGILGSLTQLQQLTSLDFNGACMLCLSEVSLGGGGCKGADS
jgi:hypothetical protein